MNFTPFAAATLLLASGSALAFDPKADPAKDELAAVDGKGVGFAAYKEANAKPAAYYADGKPLIVPAATVTWEKDEAMAGDPDLDLAETSIKDGVPSEPAVGGPLVKTAAVDMSPRAASQDYPACQPGPGDDNCIQLYEPGVETALASWRAPTGGAARPGEALAAATTTRALNAQSLAVASAQVEGTAFASAGTDQPAVGGPYEPVDDELAMNGDGDVDETFGETEDVAAL